MSKQRLQMLPVLWGNTLKLNHIIWPREQAFVSDWLLRRSPVCRAQAELRWVVGREETAVMCGEQWIRMRYEKQGREAVLMAERGKCNKKREHGGGWLSSWKNVNCLLSSVLFPVRMVLRHNSTCGAFKVTDLSFYFKSPNFYISETLLLSFERRQILILHTPSS